MKTAEEWIAEGYRLHWVTVEKEIPVLVKPEDADTIGDFAAERWATEDGGDWLVVARVMTEEQPIDVRRALPFCAEDDTPTIGALLDAQAEAEKTAQAIRDSGQLSIPGTE